MQRYRLDHPIAAIENSARGWQIVQIAAGDVVTTPEIDKQNGLVEIRCQGRNLWIYIEDLRNRAKPVASQAC